MKKGIYLMLEGGENVGKSTQFSMLKEYFSQLKIPFKAIREPGETEQGNLIRDILLNRKEFYLHPLTELFLYEADRVETFDKIIIPSIKKGTSILEDRSWPSTYSYQGSGGKLNESYKGLVNYLNKIATFDFQPDFLFIIDGKPSDLIKKIKNPDRMESKDLDFHERVRKGYLEVAKKYSDISVIIPYQEGNPEKMHEQIRYHINKKLDI